MRILIVEDEPSIANFISDGLQEEGFAVDIANNGKLGLQYALDNLEGYDVILLDWMLPGLSGIEVCRSIRKESKNIPILFLTAKDTVDEAIFGLETGANDYIRKPFSFEELLARIRVHMRKNETNVITFTANDIELNVEKHTVPKIIFL